jgi:hypothetical protein
MAVSSANVLRVVVGSDGCPPCRGYIGSVPVRYLVVLRNAYGLAAMCYCCI